MGVHTHQFPDYLLVEPKELEVRKVYSAFYRLWQMHPKSVKHYSISVRSQPSIDPVLPDAYCELNDETLIEL